MNEHGKINYVEFPSNNLSVTKDFFYKHSAGCLKILVLNTRHFLIKGLMVVFINPL